MKFTEPRDSNLANQSNRQLNQLNKLWLLGVVGLVTAIATTSLVQAQTPKVPAKPFDAGACPSDTNAAMMPHQGMSNHMMMTTGEAADRHFIEMMIPHHDGAVKMADLALKRSKNTDVLKLATAIKRDQNLEIMQMRDWYKQWYKADVPDMASRPMKPSTHMMSMGNMTGMPSNRMGKMGMNMMATDLKKLETAKDSDFDKEFLAEMIPHHKMALMMSNMIVDSDRPEMRKLAQNILRSQSQEIDQMRVWYNKF
ncbi:DUF305 domain-containing protein [Pseudanabaena mucicola]|uniref:DUF305 domain-containing protein n=1 Tax=Pseudanabaena mucicola FACHB-723 TaxID=2692860 RepID=A0ABR7ZYG1_9CYAN|nr:DUF305 domain-containing protein [Pseudanabaena mucicola]MBD2188458.1 DUF305 domain-containing protein [Pseudanabaena mucicola FACHB-723]